MYGEVEGGEVGSGFPGENIPGDGKFLSIFKPTPTLPWKEIRGVNISSACA